MPVVSSTPTAGARYLLDTNTLIYAQKQLGRCLEAIERHAPDALAWSVISLQELSLGVAKSSHPQRVHAYLAELRRRYRLFDYTAECAAQTGALQGSLQRLGTPIGPHDLQIAGIALAHDLTVVTRNTRGFSRVPNLKIEDWYD